MRWTYQFIGSEAVFLPLRLQAVSEREFDCSKRGLRNPLLVNGFAMFCILKDIRPTVWVLPHPCFKHNIL